MPQNSVALKLSISRAHEDLYTYQRFMLNIQNEIADLLSTARLAIAQSRELMLIADRILRR